MNHVKRWSSAEIWKAFGEEFDYPTELVSAKDFEMLEKIAGELEARRSVEYHSSAREIARLKEELSRLKNPTVNNDNKPRDPNGTSNRDLFTDGFTAEDFDDNTYLDMQDKEDAAARANQLLREALASAQVVCGYADPELDIANFTSGPWSPSDTHTARLVTVKKIGEET